MNFSLLEIYGWDEYLADSVEAYMADAEEEEIARHFWDDLEKC